MRNSSVCLRCNGDARCEVASATAFLSSSAGTASPLAHFFATASQYALSKSRFLGGIVACVAGNRYLAGISLCSAVSGRGEIQISWPMAFGMKLMLLQHNLQWLPRRGAWSNSIQALVVHQKSRSK